MQTFDDKSSVKTTLATVDLIRGTSVDKTGLPEQLVCGYVEQINPDEIIEATLIDSFKGLASLPRHGAIFFGADADGARLLKLLIDNAALIGVSVINLKGYPDAIYSPAYDQLVWDCPTIAYDELVAELVSSERIDKMKRDEAGERQKPRAREKTVDKPRVKHFSDFVSGEVTDETVD